ncbi:OmpH family outer membrane protein [Salmonella enterica subsp. enterica serovar Toulon]|nr:OmpH family outer membrane protein [Salmonella enterica subsp. enterica serovar Toulon]
MATTRSLPWLFILLLLSVFLCAVWFIFSSSGSQLNDKPGGIAYVSYDKILEESTILAQENIRNEEVIALANAASKRAEEKYYALPEPIRREIRIMNNMSKNNKLMTEKSNVRRISLKVISAEIEKYRVENHYSIVFNKDIALPPSDGRDISNLIINKIKGIEIEYGEYPIFSEVFLKQYE